MGMRRFCRKIIGVIGGKIKGKEQNACIRGAYSNKISLVSCNSYAQNGQ